MQVLMLEPATSVQCNMLIKWLTGEKKQHFERLILKAAVPLEKLTNGS